VPLPDPSNEVYRLEWWADGERIEVLSRETSDGFVFVCQQCGFDHPWGAKYFPNRALTKFYGACRNHPAHRLEIPGSMILWFAEQELERMPDVLVEREFNVHLAYYLKESQRETQFSGDTRKAVPRISAEELFGGLEGGTGTSDFAGA
jgi:hypothetical protein